MIDLSPPALNSESLKESLQCLRNQVRRLHDLDVTLKITAPDDIEDGNCCLLRSQVARELLFNVVKNAQIKKATLEPSSVGDELRMMISRHG